ncbi:CDC13 (YDL220C) [Zygosaccharomyces parabailii]|nr:CDC13 (YDL220C) [Zygosaccharomyces parabailii]
MVMQYEYVRSTTQFLEFQKESSHACVPVEFISLLTSIRHQRSDYVLELNNFKQSGPEELPHLMKLPYSSGSSQRLARMVISLLCQRYSIVLPELQGNAPFSRENIQASQLCFLQCKGIYNAASHSKYSVCLEDVKPWRLEEALEEAQRPSREGNTIAHIMENLTRMHRDADSKFQFDFAACPPLHKYVTSVQLTNPIFTAAATAMRLQVDDSQNEFNSMMDTWRDTMPEDQGRDRVREDRPCVPPPAKIRKLDVELDSLDLPAGTVLPITGQFLAAHPLADLMYFLPKGWKEPAVLQPGVNCIEVAAPPLPLVQEMSLQLVRKRWDLPQGAHSLQWALKDPPAPPERRDPLIWFNELRLAPGDVKYVSMIGLLVSCTFERSNYVSMVFTDFTTNQMPQKYLFDRYLIEFENKLKQEEGFRTMMYPNQFRAFDAKIAAHYRHPLAALQQTGTENVSKHLILCRMSLKLKLYNDKLNAIVRECEPLTNATVLTVQERAHVWKLKQKAQESHQLQLSMQPDVIPSAHADAAAHYDLIDGSNLQELQAQTDLFSNVLYKLDARILLIARSEDRVELLVTNDIIADRFVDPKRILRIEILGHENLRHFTASWRDGGQLVGNECVFRLARGLIGVRSQIGMLTWCPVECTFEELRIKKEA